MILATITFRVGLGRYAYHEKVMPGTGIRAFIIGQMDNPNPYCFTYDEEQAKHIVLALNALDAKICGDVAAEREFLSAADKLKSH